MAEPHIPRSLTDTEVAIHTVPLPGEAKVLIFVEANAHVTHVLSLAAQAARQLIVGLLDALDVVALDEDDAEQSERG